jgi:DHA2 family methylenomycin A resistance protein-like MFS transporter
MTTCQRGSLAAAALGLVLVLLDASVVNIAFDRLLQKFDTDIAGLQWVVNSYTLSLAALLLAGGALGDRFGARNVFVCGLSVFTAASLGCAAAHSFAALIIARMGQGVGAALMVPTSLSMLQLAFPVLEQRSRAVGWWAAKGGASMAVGKVGSEGVDE